MTKHKCQLCENKDAIFTCNSEKDSELKFEYYFCRECFEIGTIIVGLWRWKQLHPEYQHPLIEIKKEDSFNDIKKKYLEIKDIVGSWKNKGC